MLMIAISIVFSGRSTVSPSQDSRLLSRLLVCLSIFFNQSFLTETQGTPHSRCKITEYQGVCKAKQQIYFHFASADSC